MGGAGRNGHARSRGASGPSGRWRLRPQGDRCLTIELGTALDLDVARRGLALAQAIRQAGLPGVVDVVPSFAAVTVHFGPCAPGAGDPQARLGAWLEGLRDLDETGPDPEPRRVDVPVCYGGVFGPDLPEVAQELRLSPQAVVDLHARDECTVLMLGFAPGHPYIGLADEALRIPRRRTPRVRVERGSVAIANRQTVMYPAELPSGWHVIGRTPLVLFDVARAAPALLAPGDRVRFVPITPDEFERRARDASAGR